MGDLKCLNCVGCGQCILTCPKRVLQPKNSIHEFLNAKKDKKICIAYVAPGSRVSIGDKFGYEPGALLGTKLVGLLKKLGFKYVFDVTFGADLTIMEEASELIYRIKNKKTLPMMTSCCPAWVRYAQIFYP
jgi:NADH-quinone oxidoreductase subunit G